ncbi:carboxymuconolactone decarboxylase family protein [Dermatobacter hominis]|uniref:carboxymuconolactone decarboxylase family protein n=1 Tax=Dermatobacter hominis TaxID=2884263 RepID=UPI001D115D2C|nr:carboxymuconolactone decarboxylase family protein [Dermatobacter hominis]UDY36647.1 carboxymuconolactone decarboxylase family protein [Dermatobacter hominis]
MARLDPIPPEQWPPAMRDALAALRPPAPTHPFPPRRDDRPKGLNILGTLAHHPRLTTAYHTFNGQVQFGTTLTQRQRELLVLRVAVVRDCEYEWAQHAVIAVDVGLGDDEVARVAEGPDATGWDPLEAALLRAVDELVADARISDATWEVLAASLDAPQLMDVIFTVGAYETLAMLIRSAGTELDDDLRRDG